MLREITEGMITRARPFRTLGKEIDAKKKKARSRSSKLCHPKTEESSMETKSKRRAFGRDSQGPGIDSLKSTHNYASRKRRHHENLFLVL